jgi:3-dehydrosphinganine reductase
MTHVIITGGSSGIGLTLARIYASRGARISLLARTISALETAHAELSKGGNADAIRIESADVADEGQTAAAIAR